MSAAKQDGETRPVKGALGTKAGPNDFFARFREIISDPLNFAIPRHPDAGFIDGEHVILHNGLKAIVAGPHAYYGNFARILVINRGVHEPLEEYAFQEILKVLPEAPVMIELGAYWSHYSMWMKQQRPKATNYMVEPESVNIEAGRQHFALNGFEGEFIQAFVGKEHFQIDPFVEERGIKRIDVLHSDIQGFEIEMLEGARGTIAKRMIDYFVVSTHGQDRHNKVVSTLQESGYRIEASADYKFQTTSFDGVVIASRNELAPVLPGFEALGREEINQASPQQLLESVQRVVNGRKG
jgi:hypothetical protein